MLITCGNEMKWGSLEPNPGQYNFGPADVVYNYVKKNNKLLRIHTLFAQTQNPGFVDQLNDKQKLKDAMFEIMRRVIQRYSEKAIAIDVCNEIIDDDGNLRDLPWKRLLGPEYVEMVYSKAREYAGQYNKKMLLFINDYGIESQNKKSSAMLQLATSLHKKKKLDGVGFQCHFVVGQVPKDLKQTMERFTSTGLVVAVTELDIRIQIQGRSPQDVERDRQQQAQDFITVFDICKQVRGCVSFTVWGVTFKDSWIGSTPQFNGFGEAVLFNENYQGTQAFKKLLGDGFGN